MRDPCAHVAPILVSARFSLLLLFFFYFPHLEQARSRGALVAIQPVEIAEICENLHLKCVKLPEQKNEC